MTITPRTAVPAAHAQQLGLAPVETLNGKAALDGIINVWRAFIREGGDYRTATGIVTNGQGDFWVAVAPPQDNPAFNLWSFIMPKVAPHWAALANGGPRLVSPNLSPVTLSQIVEPANGSLAAIGTPDMLAAALRASVKDKTIPTVEHSAVDDLEAMMAPAPPRKSLFDRVPAPQPPVAAPEPAQPEAVLPEPVVPEPPTPPAPPAPIVQAPAPAPITPPPAPAPAPIIETPARPTPAPVAPTPVTSIETNEDDMTGFFDDDETTGTTYSLHSLTTEETWPILTRPVVIGRSSTRSEISVSRDSSLSRSHAQIYEQDGQVIITDLGSKNGTHIGSHRLQPHTPTIVPDGALLRLGHVTFNVVKEQA